ncbi:hypothetical protein MC885_014316 [Smutsia gigantea]|nr:hypothetical protein MC885_014316 [Smutsia gigantea]
MAAVPRSHQPARSAADWSEALASVARKDWKWPRAAGSGSGGSDATRPAAPSHHPPRLSLVLLLPVLGACAVVGPSQGPEWKPVWALLSEDCRCRDPRCCSNLLVLCLFAIWQGWVVLAPDRQDPPQYEEGHQVLASSGAWMLMSTMGTKEEMEIPKEPPGIYPHQGPPWDFHTLSEPTFCTTSFSSTCLVPQDSSLEAWQVSWCFDDEQINLICKPLSPALDTHQGMEQLLVPSQEELVPLEPIVSRRSHPTSVTLVISLPNLPLSQRLQFCSREFLHVPFNQRVGMTTLKSWSCPQEAWVPGREKQMLGREESQETWAARSENQMERVRHKEGNSQRTLEWRVLLRLRSWGWENQDQMGIENRAKIQILGERNQREAGGENPPAIQAPRVENQKQLRWKIDAKTQTPEWGVQDKNSKEDTTETQVFEKNKGEARGEDEGGTQVPGLGKRGETKSENDETQVPGWGKQDQNRGDNDTEIETEERRHKDQVGEWKKEEQVGGEIGADIQAQEKPSQREAGGEDSTETWAPGEENQSCLRGDIDRKTHLSEWKN